jgi:FkbM family methyltransferase
VTSDGVLSTGGGTTSVERVAPAVPWSGRGQPHLRAVRTAVRKVPRALAARSRTARFVRRVPVGESSAVITIGDLDYGGYQLPADLLHPEAVVVSAGAGTDIGFESMLVDRFGCRVHLLDPVPESAAYAVAAVAHEPRIRFEQAALWNDDGEVELHAPEIDGHVSHSATDLYGTPVALRARARSLGSLRAEHGWPRVDLLKISVVGAEFVILERVMEADEPVSALCVEFTQPVPVDRVEAAVKALGEHGYVAVARSARPFTWKMTFVRR